MVFYLADMDMPLTVGQGAVNTTEAGRYSTEGWVQQVKSTNVKSNRKWQLEKQRSKALIPVDLNVYRED